MDYNFFNFNPKDFEHLVQSLMQKELGNSSLVFGEGRDGARELTYEGSASFDKDTSWDGYWVIQAKFKSKADSKDNDFEWIKKNYDAEIKKFRDKTRNLKTPQNYILFTNASLSAVADVGGIDKIKKHIEKDNDIIENIVVVYYDILCRLLDNNRDVATSYASFILSGDILQKLYKLLEDNSEAKRRALSLFLMKEFNNELHAKLIQAGDLNHSINIENVFIDLHATENGIAKDEDSKFIKSLISTGNECHKGKPYKVVLIGGAGAGKSTLSQFAVQLYSAYFLKREQKNYSEVNHFLANYDQSEIAEPLCCRFPIKIVLKEYAEWVSKKSKQEESLSVVSYLSQIISKSSDSDFNTTDLRNILSKLSFLFVFDGLDEVPSTSNRNILIKEINSFIDIDLYESKCDALIVATTRPQGFSNEFASDKFKHLKVCELTDNTCIHYLNRFLHQVEESEKERERLISILREAIKDATIGRLMRTPLQATIMSILVRSDGEPSNNRFRLFNDYYTTIFKREKQKAIYKVLNSHERIIDEIHFKLAYNLQTSSENAQNPAAYISNQDFRDFIVGILKEEGFSEEGIQTLSNNICANVTERLVFISEIQDQKVGFIIRSMQEFFAARYLLSLCDEDIKTVLENISKNVYWRNTLLFLIGGLHIEHKSTLVECVIALCHKMNGEDCSPSETNSNKLLCLGSWLALDILIEGSFADSPKNENVFINLLRHILSLPPTDSLEKFRYLPERIIRECIIKDFIGTSIARNYETSAKIISYLSVNEVYDKEICDSYFAELSKNKEQVFLLISALQKNSPNSLLLKVLLKNALVKYEIDEIYNLFYNNAGKPKVYESLLNDTSNKNKLLEIYFLLLLQSSNRSGNFNNYFLNNIFKLANLKIPKKNKRRWFFAKHEEKVTEWYSKRYFVLQEQDVENKISIIDLVSIYDGISVNYILDYLSFCNSVSKENVKKLFISMYKQGEKVFSVFIQSPLWYINEIKNELPDFEKLSESMISDVIDSSVFITKANDIQEKFDHLKYNNSRMLFDIDNFEDFDEVYDIVVKNNSEITACKELLLTFYAIHDVYYPQIHYLQTINDATKNRISQSLICSDISKKVFYIEEVWLLFAHYLNAKEFFDILEKSSFDNFSTNTKRLLWIDYIFSERSVDNIFSVFNSTISLGKETPIICLVFALLMNDISLISKFGEIDKNEFFKTKYHNQIAQTYQVIICLLMSSEKDYDNDVIIKIKEIQERYDIISLIADVFECTKINREWMEVFIVDIISLFETISYDNKKVISKYYNLLFNICGRKLSNMKVAY